ncbi:EscE/YscE/SsaE family type III secretion system needle protein co-chaperone [Serratia proteamaculans]
MARLTHLETQLRRDREGNTRNALLSRLETAEQHLKRQLQKTPDAVQSQQIIQLLAANTQAMQVIAILWHRYHAGSSSGEKLCY